MGVSGGQNGKQFFLQQTLEFVNVADLLAVSFVAQLFEHFMCGRGAEISADQRGFQIVERRAVNFFADGNHIFNAFGEIFAGAGDCLFHALQKAGLLFEAAKKGLDHKRFNRECPKINYNGRLRSKREREFLMIPQNRWVSTVATIPLSLALDAVGSAVGAGAGVTGAATAAATR